MNHPRHWSVVIPSDSLEKTIAAATSVLKAHEKVEPSRIVVVTQKLAPTSFPKELKGIRIVNDFVKEFSFARRVNLGFLEADQDDVVVMGDDVEVITPGAFDTMALEAPLRITSPSIRGRVGPWWQKEKETHPEVPFVSFVCVYIPRMVRLIVGKVDGGFGGYGYDDTDYCLRARKAGLSCGVIGSVVVEHGIKNSSEFMTKHGDNLIQLEKHAKINFTEKWRKRDI